MTTDISSEFSLANSPNGEVYATEKTKTKAAVNKKTIVWGSFQIMAGYDNGKIIFTINYNDEARKPDVLHHDIRGGLQPHAIVSFPLEDWATVNWTTINLHGTVRFFDL